MKEKANRSVAGLLRIVGVGGLVLFAGSCALPFVSGGGGGGGGGKGGGASLDSQAVIARDSLAENLSASGSLTPDQIETIVNGAVGSITGGSQGSTEEILTDLVGGAQRSLGDLTGLTDQQRNALVDTIVGSAVGSIGAMETVSSSSIAPSSLFALDTPSERATVIAAIASISIATLNESGYQDDANVPDATGSSIGAIVRTLRAAGVRSNEINALLRLLSGRSVESLGEAGLDQTGALEALETITAAITESLDEANVEGVDLDRDLARLVREISSGAIASITSTGVAGFDADDVQEAVRQVTRNTTRSVRNVTLSSTDPAQIEQTLARVVREVATGTSQAIADAAANSGGTVTIDITLNIRAVVNGTSRGVDELKQGFGDQVNSFVAVFNEVAKGASEGAQRIADVTNDSTFLDGLEDALEAELAAVSQQVAALENELEELRRDLQVLISQGQAEALNNAPQPTVVATVGSGTPQTISGGTTIITGDEAQVLALDATESDDPDGDELEYAWFFDFGPVLPAFFDSAANAAAGLSDSSSTTGRIDPRSGDVDEVFVVFVRPGEYFFTLVVDDGITREELFFGVVIPGGDPDNRAPLAAARPTADGSDATRRVFSRNDTVILNGQATTDPDGDTLSYAWSIEAAPRGSEASILDADQSLASFQPDVAGTYFILFTADDGIAISEQFFSITVQGPPIADAGANRTVPRGPFTLDGTNSFDPDGDEITSYVWQFVSHDPGNSIRQPNTEVGSVDGIATFTPDKLGTYTFRLTVTAGGEQNAVDETVQIRVLPRVNAGLDQQILLGSQLPVALDGSATPDVAGYEMTYTWSVVSAPASVTPATPTPDSGDPRTASFVPDAVTPGSYVLRLTADAYDPLFDVTFSSSDTVQIDVVDTTDQPPIASAGTDLTVPVGQIATLSGSASDPDDDPLSIRWDVVAKPSNSRISSFSIAGADTASPTFTPDVSGQFRFRITVSANGLTASDDVVVTATAASSGDGPFTDLDLSGFIFQFFGDDGTGRFATQVLVTDQPQQLLLNLETGEAAEEIRAVVIELVDAEDTAELVEGEYTPDGDTLEVRSIQFFDSTTLGVSGPETVVNAAGLEATAAEFAEFNELPLPSGDYFQIVDGVVTVNGGNGEYSIEWTVEFAGGRQTTGTITGSPVAYLDPREDGGFQQPGGIGVQEPPAAPTFQYTMYSAPTGVEPVYAGAIPVDPHGFNNTFDDAVDLATLGDPTQLIEIDDYLYPGDIDVYSLTLPDTGNVVDFEFVTTYGAFTFDDFEEETDTLIRLYDTDRLEIDSNDDDFANESVFSNLPLFVGNLEPLTTNPGGATFYIVVSGFDAFSVGPYRLIVRPYSGDVARSATGVYNTAPTLEYPLDDGRFTVPVPGIESPTPPQTYYLEESGGASGHTWVVNGDPPQTPQPPPDFTEPFVPVDGQENVLAISPGQIAGAIDAGSLFFGPQSITVVVDDGTGSFFSDRVGLTLVSEDSLLGGGQR